MKAMVDDRDGTTRRGAARAVLAAVVAGVALFALFAGGPRGALAQVLPMQTTESPTGEPSESPTGEPSEQPSPTETPEPTGPAVTLLNPAAEYQPGLDQTGDETPKISDKFDGVNETFHIAAVTRGAPQGAIVEAFWQPSGGGETSIGTLTRLDDGAGAWGLEWDVPEDLSGAGTMVVKLFNGTNELAIDSEAAEIDNNEETVEIGWPTNGGRLGWFKPKGGNWRAAIEGTTSRFAQRVFVYYTTSPNGSQPVYKNCAATTYVNPPAAAAGTNFRRWTFTCELAGTDVPSDLTGIAAVATETDNPIQPGASGLLTNESGDAHRVVGYAQEVEDMTLSIAPAHPATVSAAYPTGDAQEAGNDCLEFNITVLDGLERPVQGANVDIHLQGPGDEAGFGDEGAAAHGSSSSRPPNDGGHENEEGWDCDSPGARFGDQGEHELPDRDDVKHIESTTTGTGMSGPTGIRPGQFRFHIFSEEPGRSFLTAWVDEEPLKKETGVRDADDDVRGPGEASDTYEAQWLAGPTQVRLVPSSDSFVTGSCNQVTVSVRGGRTPVEGANVDVHATGPTNDLDFCDPPGASPNRAPEDGSHDDEDSGEGSHPPEDPDGSSTQHTEGETDDSGAFVIGLRSPADGDTTLQAWVDGGRGSDNDVQDSGEPSGNGGYTWASSADDATVRFLNPSGYGDGAGYNVSVAEDGNEFFHIITRVDLPSLIDGVEILVSSDDGASFSKIGDAVRIGQSDVYQFQWTAPIDEGSYTLRARIVGTDRSDDAEIDLDNSLNTVELSRPANNEAVAFVEQTATVEGTASAEAEGATFYYAQTAARDVNDAAAWTECGTVELEAPGDAPQQFQGDCTLAEGDQAGSVTGIAAIADTCDPLAGCDPPLGAVMHESGDAHRAFGLDSTPIVGLRPAGGEGAKGTCQRIVVDVEDQAGGGVPGADVDVHLDGPGGNVHFCNPDGSFDNRDAPNEGNHAPVQGNSDEGRHQNSGIVHTEGQTGSNGRFVVGIVAKRNGTSRVTAWVDETENDVEDGHESSAKATFRWVDAGRCTVRGTGGDDVLDGTPGNDRICGLGGDDVIDGRGGNDVIIGGGGRDIIRGGRGKDRLIGGKGDDSLVGGAGNDLIKGGKGHDVLSGKGGRDTLRGGPGNDNLKGGSGRDRCFGNGGADKFRGCERQQQ